jgi:hypothetical protein
LYAPRERILVGEPSRDARPAALDPALVEAFEAAFPATRLLVFTYRDQQCRSTKRRAEPARLAACCVTVADGLASGVDPARLARALRQLKAQVLAKCAPERR